MLSEPASLAPWITLALFTFSTSITPGPNNLMLTMTGAHFGLRAALPALLGIVAGMALLIVLASAGVASLLLAFPLLDMALRGLGLAYLLWLAWTLCASGARLQGREVKRPMTLLEAVLFQFTNPKAWMMAVTAASVFAPALLPMEAGLTDRLAATLAVVLSFALIGGPCVASWAVLGALLQRWLQQGQRLQFFNRLMGLLLAITAVAMAGA